MQRIRYLAGTSRAASLLALLHLLTTVTMSYANEPGDAISLLNVPIGETREVVMPTAQSLWESTAVCVNSKTGVGVNRRAYFLETCTFDNSRGNTLYDETPSTSVYYFLDGRLVQIAYEFEQLDNLKKHRRCAMQDLAKLDKAQNENDTNRQSISVADDGRTVIFHAELVPQIHALKDAG